MSLLSPSRQPAPVGRSTGPLRCIDRPDGATLQTGATTTRQPPPRSALARATVCASVDRDICHVNITFEAQIKHTTRTIERNHAINAEVTFCVRGVISPLLINLYLNEVDK